MLYGGAEEPHCLGVGSNTLLAVEQCRYSGLALSRQLFTVLGGGDWVVLQPSAQWGQCIGLEHVEQDARGEAVSISSLPPHALLGKGVSEVLVQPLLFLG